MRRRRRDQDGAASRGATEAGATTVGIGANGPLFSASAWAVALLVGLIAFCAFLPALECDFNYDDDENILRNENFRGLSWSNLRWMFTTFHMGHYQPLTWLSLAVDHELSGMSPRGYHLTNVLLHSANTALVVLLAASILRAAGRRRADGALIETPAESASSAGLYLASFVAALLFAVHPLRVESVAWVTERRDVLSSFWLLATILLYLHAQLHASEHTRRRWMIAAFCCYLLSLLSRAMGVTLPIILVLLDWYPLGRLGGEAGWFGRGRAKAWLEKLPYLAAAIAFGLVAPRAQATVGATIALEMHGPLERVAQACYGLVFYVHKLLLPECLSPLYELRLPLDPWAAKYVLSAGLLLVTVMVVVAVRRRHPAVLVAVAAYAILLAPVLGFVQSGRQEVADRYSYLPSICLVLLVGGLIASWWRQREQMAAAGGLALLCVVVSSVLGVLTWRQCQVWKDPLSLWTHGSKCQPKSFLAFYNLGCAQAVAGMQDSAVASFEQAITLNPAHIKSRFNMGNALQELGRHDEAIRAYQSVLEIDPNDALAHYELGRVFAAQARTEDAAAAFRRAVALRSDYPKANVNLGVMLAKAGNHPEAVEQFELAIRIEPDLRDAHYNLAISLDALDRAGEAAAAYERTIALDPRFADARVNLGNIRVRQGRLEDAVRAYEEALRLVPNHPAAQANLTALRARMNQPS